jgi:hypothetical protein
MRGFFVAVILALTPVVALSQTEPALSGATSGAAGLSAPQARIFAALGLTAEQSARISTLSATWQARSRAIVRRQTPGRAISDADRVELHRLGEQHNTAVRALLTASQRSRLDAWLESQHATHTAEARRRLEARRALMRGDSGARAVGANLTPAGAPLAPRLP